MRWIPINRAANLVDFRLTSLFRFYSEVKKLAEQFGTTVSGSELVGMAPKIALIASVEEYLETEGRKKQCTEEEAMNTAIDLLGLDDIRSFSIHEKVLEYRWESVSGKPWPGV